MTNPFAYHQSTALITGASRGIGAEIARVLCEQNIAALILTARNQEDLDELARELKEKRADLRVETIAADLAYPDSAHALWKETTRRGLSVDLLVNNAGFGSVGYFDELSAQKESDMVSVNVGAVVALTRLFLPPMLAKKRGGVLNVSSTAAFQPVAFMATYGATKAFVLSFSQALWAELKERGPDIDVRIVALCPGGTDTHFADDLENDRGRFEAMSQDTPREVALAALHALDTNASSHVVGTGNYVGTLGARLLPRSTMAKMTARIFRPQTDETVAADTKQKRKLVAGAAVIASCAAAGIALAAYKKKA